MKFSNDSGILNGGALSATGKSNVTFKGNSSLRFINNSANDQGGGINTITVITTEENCHMVFHKNNASLGGAMHLYDSSLKLKEVQL